MRPSYLSESAIEQFIQSALMEDIGPGDYSSLEAISKEAVGTARLWIKDRGVLAGMELAELIFKAVDPRLELVFFKKDGDPVVPGDFGFEVTGPVVSILSAERVVLNCLQRMSAIATKTQGLSQLIAHTRATLLDTRKTTPNFRLPEKWAVFIGGGQNHRFALYDRVMLKDNHIDFAGGIAKAVSRAQAYLKENNLSLQIEVETRSLAEVEEVLKIGGVDYILLDNMDPATLRAAVKRIDGQIKTEASGGITAENLVEIAECGVDFISMGALTHSVSSLDLSLKASQ